MSLYTRQLKRLGIGLIVLNLFKIAFVMLLADFLLEADFDFTPVYSVARGVVAIMAGSAMMLLVRHENWVTCTLILSVILLIATMTMLVIDEGKPDAIINTSLLLLIVAVYLQHRMSLRMRMMAHVKKRPPVTLDLRVSGKGELFNPIVMGPHLELNANILNAVDRFLINSGQNAPMNLCIHSAETISEPLQATMIEVYRAHYEDEQRRIDRFLQGRYSRSFVLIIVSITALRVLGFKIFKYDKGMLVQILSNFAGFSLWQIGSTFFERSKATEDLMRVKIAMEANITFY